MKTIKTLLTLALFNLSVANACEDPCAHRWWLNIGLGAGSTNENAGYKVDGPAGQISFNGMLSDNLFLTLASTHLGGNNDDEANELGLLLGYKSKRPNWYWSISTGIANLEVQKRYNTYDYVPSLFGGYTTYYLSYTEETNRFAVPVEGQLFWTPFKHFGVGVIGHAAISKQSMGAVMLGVQIS